MTHPPDRPAALEVAQRIVAMPDDYLPPLAQLARALIAAAKEGETRTLKLRDVAIALYMVEMDWPDLVSREQAIGCYDHPDSTGPHCGDCTNVACTCLRCMRDEIDKKAAAIIAALEQP